MGHVSEHAEYCRKSISVAWILKLTLYKLIICEGLYAELCETGSFLSLIFLFFCLLRLATDGSPRF